MTSLQTILSALASSTLVASAVVWLARTWISERLHQSIAHEYANKLERHKAELAAAASVELERIKAANAQERAVRALGEDQLREALRVAHAKRVEAIGTLWNAVLLLGKNTPQAVGFTDYLAEDEIPTMERTPGGSEALADLSIATLRVQLLAPTEEIAYARLSAGDYLHAVCDAYRSVIARASFLMMQSRETQAVSVWYRDAPILRMLTSVLSAEEMKQFSGLAIGRMTWVRQRIEATFLAHARKVMSGEESVGAAVQQARAIEEAVAALKHDYPREL